MKKALVLLLLLISVKNMAQSQLVETPWYLQSFIIDDVTYVSPIPNTDTVLYFSVEFFNLEHLQCVEVYSSDFDANETMFTTNPPAVMLIGFGCSNQATQWYNLDYDFYSIFSEVAETFSYEIIEQGGYNELIVTNSDGDQAFYADTPLGTVDNKIPKISFYPNPTNDLVMISEPDSLRNISVYDIVGNNVMKVHQASQSIDLRTLSGGIYILKGEDESGNLVTAKIMKR